MPDLSPAAQAVIDAAYHRVPHDKAHTLESRLAAALRAAADQVVAVEELPQVDEESCIDHLVYGSVHSRQKTRLQLLAIATELEADR